MPIITYILADQAPAHVSDKEILFYSPETQRHVQVWDHLYGRYFLSKDKAIQISIPFQNNRSSLPEDAAMAMFDSAKLTYQKLLPRISRIDFQDSTEKWYLYFTSERSGYYVTYNMKYNDPMSGIHELDGVGKFCICDHE